MIGNIRRKIQEQLEKQNKASEKERETGGVTFFNRIISSKPEKVAQAILELFGHKEEKIKKIKDIKTTNNRTKITALISKIRNTIRNRKGKKTG